MVISIALSVCTLSSCSYFKNISLLTGGSMIRENFVQEIPFHYRKGLIVVEARLNDDTTAREFIFDTGAFNSKIEKSLAEELGLETVTTKENSTAQGNTQVIEVTRIDSVRFGETTFYNIGAGKLEYAEDSYSPCLAKDGLIGSNLIKLAHWKIDYQNQKIYCSDQPFQPQPDLDQVVVPFDHPTLSTTPKINLKVGGGEVKGLMFDTGFNGGLIMPAALSDAFPTTDTKTFIDRSTSGIYGTNTDTLIEKTLSIRLGADNVQIPVEFSSLGKGLLGNDVLEHFTVHIDTDKDEITLQQTSTIEVKSGAPFLVGILNDSLWIVNRVSEQTVKLQLGDTLRSVNGRRPAEVFVDRCNYFFNIRSFLSADSLIVRTSKNETIRLK